MDFYFPFQQQCEYHKEVLKITWNAFFNIFKYFFMIIRITATEKSKNNAIHW